MNIVSKISKNQVNFYYVSEKDENQRLDNLLIKLLKGVPKSYIYRIIREAQVRVNKKRVTVNYKVIIGDIIRIPPVNINVITTPIKNIPNKIFPIIFEDDYFLVINKPEGIACHGGSGVSYGIIEQLRQNYPQYKFLELVHRLDRNTSGILILAKKRQSLVALQDLIRNKKMKKYYLALTNGALPNKIYNVKEPLFKYVNHNGERSVKVDYENGKPSHSIFSVVKKFKDFTLVKADIKTGRTHQIRVHLKHIGYPIVGDDKYGNFELNKKIAKIGFNRMGLHACEVEFIHPITRINLLLKAELPDSFNKFFEVLT